MAICVPGFNLFTNISIQIGNIPYAVENVKYKHQFKKRKLSYKDIVRVEYDSMETPEFIFQNMCVDKKIVDKKEFNKIVNTLRKYKVLNWKRYYFANFLYYDGGSWKITITFSDGSMFETQGDITTPRNYQYIYEAFEEHIIESTDEELNEKIIDKWFKDNSK